MRRLNLRFLKQKTFLIAAPLAAVAAAFVITQFKNFQKVPSQMDPVKRAAEQIATGEVSDEIVETDSTYLGFDTYKYPGDEAMRAWKHEDVPYDWVGYYLPAPCHKGTTWVGKRETLEDMGWGIAVVYVGQQTWSRTPRTTKTTWRMERDTVVVKKRVKEPYTRNGKRATRWVTKSVPEVRVKRTPVKEAIDVSQRPLDECNADLLGTDRGTVEADDAIKRAEAEGFPHTSTIFLDIERMEKIPQEMRDYYRSWTRRVLEDGRYVPGYYTHKANAADVYADVKPDHTAAGRTRDPQFWIAGGKSFSAEKKPEGVGHEFAAVWQGMLDIVQEWKGFKLPIDVNLSYLPNPSAPEQAEVK